MTLVVIWAIRVLIILLVIRFVLRALHRAQVGARRGPTRMERPGGALVRDPQCGTHIAKTRAVVSGAGASALYFCSTTCRDAFLGGRR